MLAVVYFIGCCALLGAIGMAVANRTASIAIRHERWVKYFSYLIITTLIVTSIFFDIFLYVAMSIVAVGCYEIVRSLLVHRANDMVFLTFLFTSYSAVATGFLLFAAIFNNQFLFSIYLQVLIFDAFCQITGQLFGRRKLAPAISPAKTVEGLAGGLIFCIITAILFADLLQLPVVVMACLGFITAISSLAGDLSSSWLKRKLQVKDFSNLLPGQGGFLDRFDSLLMTGLIYSILASSLLKEVLSRFVIDP